LMPSQGFCRMRPHSAALSRKWCTAASSRLQVDAVRACSYRIGVSRHRARNSSSSDLVITEIDFRPRRSDNLFVGGIAAPTCAVATRNEVLTTAKALETGAASGRIRFYGY
jgi:hypothetical protein